MKNRRSLKKTTREKASGPGPGSEAPGAAKKGGLKHEVALVATESGDEEIHAPRLQRECGGDPDHVRARRVIALSREGRLRCPVCANFVERVFPAPQGFGDAGDQEAGPTDRRWHFRRKSGSGECDHEPESEAHRETKMALAAALLENLGPAGWEVTPEKGLENGRRPDVLCEHRASGRRVALEVQYADIARRTWRRRQDDYASLGIPAYWLLGAENRYHRVRDDLRLSLENEPGQRVIYVGRFKEGGGIEAREVALSYLDPDSPEELRNHRALAPPAKIASLAPGYAAQRSRGSALRLGKRRLSYAPGRMSLTSDSQDPLYTPLNAWNEKRERIGRRLRRERLEREAAERARAAEIEAERESHTRAVLRRWARVEEAWLSSAVREHAEARLGPALVEALETEALVESGHEDGPPVRATRRTGWWRVLFYSRQIAPREPGAPFAWRDAVETYLHSLEKPGQRHHPPGAKSPAWLSLRDHLVALGLLVPGRRADEWKVPPPAATRDDKSASGPGASGPGPEAETSHTPAASRSVSEGDPHEEGALPRRLWRVLRRLF